MPNFEGTTEYRVAYAQVPLPLGMPADIGLQVASGAYKAGGVGGQFELMIQQGAPAPQVRGASEAASSDSFTSL